MTECIFCKIVNKEIPSESVWEGKELLAFNDLHPKAPVHILVISKAHIASVRDFSERDGKLAGEIILAAKKIAQEKNLEGYKLIFNVGRKGGQIIDHLHLHLLGGWEEKPARVEV